VIMGLTRSVKDWQWTRVIKLVVHDGEEQAGTWMGQGTRKRLLISYKSKVGPETSQPLSPCLTVGTTIFMYQGELPL
jgi:hypothetical protein